MSLPPLDKQKRIIWHAAHKWGINPDILWGVYGTETSFGHNVSSSSAGAVGPFQFLPSTARGMGVNPYDFHSAAYGAAKYLAQYKSRGTAGMLSAYNAGPAGGIQSGYVSTTLANAKSWKDPGGLSGGGGSSGGGGTKTVGGVDNSGARRSLIAQYLLNDTTATPKLTSSSSDPLRQLQRSGQELDNLLSLQQQLQGLRDIPGHKVSTGGSGGSSGGLSGTTARKGLANFEGHTVAAWIKPWLDYARRHGWKGTVNSGYRSYAEQSRIYNSGVRPAAVPGTSNHEGRDFPRGAVDVSDAATLSAILRRAHSPLIWAGSKDPPHFSHPHNGSY